MIGGALLDIQKELLENHVKVEERKIIEQEVKLKLS